MINRWDLLFITIWVILLRIAVKDNTAYLLSCAGIGVIWGLLKGLADE